MHSPTRTALRLADCVTLASGGTPSKRRSDLWEGQIPWASGKDLKTTRLSDTQDHVSEFAIGRGTRLVPENTILLLVRGMGLLKDAPVSLTKRAMSFNQDIKALTPSAGVDPAWLLYWLVRHKSVLMGMASESAHGTKRLETDRLLNLPISPPELAKQRKIASMLSAYDDLIEANQRRIAILEEMARRLFDEWFVQFRYPRSDSSQPSEDEARQSLQAWPQKRADEIMSFDPRTTVPKAGGKIFVPMGSLSTSSMVISDWEIRTGNSGSKFQNYDTLLARITPCLENGKTGFVDFLGDDETAFGSTEYIVMRGKSVPPTFVYLLARSERFRAAAIRSMGGADGRQRVRGDALQQFQISVPPKDLLANFHNLVWPMFQQVRVLANSIVRLRTARDMLLPKLISGEIDVSGAKVQLEAAE